MSLLCVYYLFIFFFPLANLGIQVYSHQTQNHNKSLTSSLRMRPFFSKKKPLCFFFIYNFYFDNLIYKWIKQFEN